MSFFVTSAPIGKGADLGGLEGADRHCQALAQAAGAGRQDMARLPQHPGRGRGERPRPHWTRAMDEREGCRHREGRRRAPWHATISPSRPRSPRRARSSTVAATRRTCTTFLPARSPTERRFPAGEDRTCGNWTKSGAGRRDARAFRPDRLDESAPAKSWNLRRIRRAVPEAAAQPGRSPRVLAATGLSQCCFRDQSRSRPLRQAI